MRACLSKARAGRGAMGLLALLLVAACASAPEPAPLGGGGAAEPGAAQPLAPGPGGAHRVSPLQPVTVALLLPLTAQAAGPARLGRAMSNAAQLAVADLGDPALRILAFNTAGRPETAERVAQEALAAGADVLLGPLFAATTEEAGRVVAPAGRQVLSFSTNTQVAGPRVAVIGYTPEAEAERILSYAAGRGLRRIGIFYPANDYGEAALRGAQAVAGAGLVEIVALASYERSFKGIEAASGPFAETARAEAVDAVFLPAGGSELQAVGSFLNFHGVDPLSVRYLGLGVWNSRATFGEPALRGGWFPAPDRAAFARFAQRYRDRFGEDPPILSDLGYTAVQIAGQILATARAEGRAASFSAPELTRAQGFRGALGPLRVLPDGSARHALSILEVGDRQFLDLEPASQIPGAGS